MCSIPTRVQYDGYVLATSYYCSTWDYLTALVLLVIMCSLVACRLSLVACRANAFVLYVSLLCGKTAANKYGTCATKFGIEWLCLNGSACQTPQKPRG
jgi:hypothetical protein